MDIVSGVVAILLMAGLALYGVRRRAMRLPWGGARRWRQFHVYGGAAFALALLWHGGLTPPPGVLNWWVWVLSWWVAASGVIGLLVQKLVPRALAGGLSIDMVYERIPEVVESMRREAEELALNAPETVRTFYQANLAPAMAAPANRPSFFLDVTGGIEDRTRQFNFLLKHTAPDGQAAVKRLETLYRTKLECDAHYTLQKALRWWMWLHLPPSLALVVLVIMHTYLMLRY